MTLSDGVGEGREGGRVKSEDIPGEDIISDSRDAILISKGEAEFQHQGRFAGSHGAARKKPKKISAFFFFFFSSFSSFLIHVMIGMCI